MSKKLSCHAPPLQSHCVPCWIWALTQSTFLACMLQVRMWPTPQDSGPVVEAGSSEGGEQQG